jgi:ornithine racemase
MKEIRPDVRTMYLKPPAVSLAEEVVRYADVSLNSSRTAIRALNREAERQGKTHDVIVMIEMGELREGVVRDNVLSFYAEVFDLPNINVLGIGTNLGCMYGVEPNYDKLIQLSLFKQLIEAKFDHPLPLVSGSSSIALPLVGTEKLPAGVNHLRIGEAAFFGTSPLYNQPFRSSQRIPSPSPPTSSRPPRKTPRRTARSTKPRSGRSPRPPDASGRMQRCIVDFGMMDVDADNVRPLDEDVSFAGTTSDMTVYDITRSNEHYRVGDALRFRPNYMAVARLMHSSTSGRRSWSRKSPPGCTPSPSAVHCMSCGVSLPVRGGRRRRRSRPSPHRGSRRAPDGRPVCVRPYHRGGPPRESRCGHR